MRALEKEICYLSNQVYKFYYEIAKKEMDGEGEDTAPADQTVLDQRGHGDHVHVAAGQHRHNHMGK